MPTKRLGRRTLKFDQPPTIIATGTIVGPLEGKGPLAPAAFDEVVQDPYLGQKSFEKAERELSHRATQHALKKAGLQPQDLDLYFGGDLLNQLITASWTALSLGIPFFGQYGACSTTAQSLTLAAMAIDGGYANRVLISAASHNSSAERQFRFPTEYGSQRKPWAQTTVTGAGAAILSNQRGDGPGPIITHATQGQVVDLGIKDGYNQGAAMAPAAISTLIHHFHDTGRSAVDYDMIITGDLASFGRDMAIQLAAKEGLPLGANFVDCGALLFDRNKQKVDSGGSGAAAAAVVTFGHFYRQLMAGKLRRILVVATGALLSPTTSAQGENIPAIAHAVSIEMPAP